MKYIANILTAGRIIMSLFILFTEPFSVGFYVLYFLCGLTDILDGPIARKTKTESAFGAKLDSIADVCFVLVCLLKLVPVIRLEMWLLIWASVIAVIKIVNIISGFVCRRRLVMLHTAANKAAGAVLFVTAPLLGFFPGNYIFIPACVIAAFAAIQEGHFIRSKR